MHDVIKVCFLSIQPFGTTWTFLNAMDNTLQLLSVILGLGVAVGVLITGAGMVSLADVSRTEFSPILLMCMLV